MKLPLHSSCIALITRRDHQWWVCHFFQSIAVSKLKACVGPFCANHCLHQLSPSRRSSAQESLMSLGCVPNAPKLCKRLEMRGDMALNFFTVLLRKRTCCEGYRSPSHHQAEWAQWGLHARNHPSRDSANMATLRCPSWHELPEGDPTDNCPILSRNFRNTHAQNIVTPQGSDVGSGCIGS